MTNHEEQKELERLLAEFQAHSQQVAETPTHDLATFDGEGDDETTELFETETSVVVKAAGTALKARDPQAA